MSGGKEASLEGVERVESGTVWCGGCGSWFTGNIVRVLDCDNDRASVAAFIDGGPEAINATQCGNCGWTYVADDWVAVVQASAKKVFLVIPENHRHRAQQIRQEFIGRAVAGSGAVVQSYFFEPVMLVGHAELAELLLRPSVMSGDAGPRETVQTSVPPTPVSPSEQNQVLIRRKAQSLDLLAELLSDEDEDGSSLSDVELSKSSGAWARPPSIEDDPVPTVIPEDFVTELAESLDDDEQMLEAGSLVGDESLDDATGEQNVVHSLDVQPRELATDVSDGKPGDGDGPDDHLDVNGNPAVADGRVDDAGAFEGDAASALMSDPATDQPVPPPVPVPDGSHEASSIDDAEPEEDKAPEAPVATEEHAGESEPVSAIQVEDGRVVVRVACTRAQRDALSALRTALYLQGHATDDGLAIVLTIRFAAREDGDAPPALVEGFDLTQPQHKAALDALGQSFEVVTILTCAGAEPSRRVFIIPLEENAKSLAERSAETTEAALARVQAADYSLFGSLAHNFGEYSFDKMTTAAEAHLARGIVEYWTQPEHEVLLLDLLAFPRHWWRGIQTRIVQACLTFGLALDGRLRTVMRAEAELKDEALVSQLLARFSEVSLNLRANELGPLEEWGNWDQLLAWAESLGVIVDEKIEEIAARALAAAERAVEGDGPEPELSMDAIEVSLADAIDIASIGAANLAEYLDASSADIPERIDPAAADLSIEELLAALDDTQRRAGACVQILSRAPSEHSAIIFDCVMKMNGAELAIVIPSILPAVSSYIPLFRNALFADHSAHRLSAAMLLSEVGDERSLNPILNMLLDPEEPQWKLLAQAAARLGPIVIQPALSRAAVDETGTERIMVLLGHVGALFPDSLEDVAQRYDDPAVGACIEQSQALAKELDRPETPPFAFRLTALLDAADGSTK
ncbi:MAG: hypothetical protein VX589_09220 [Myxococcota bacterium]|nr:hypothetical protein [Myxococcota bacterium]